MRKAVPEETAMRIRGLIRRDAWYEAAVLHDLSIIDRKGQFSASLLRAWMLQAAALERCPPYGILRSIARAWQHAGDGTCRLFRPGNLPGESEHATPPRPAWLAFIEEEPPAAARPPYSYFSGFLRILEKYRHDLRFLHYHCFMDAHERDLLWYNLPVLRDQWEQSSGAQQEERPRRYERAICSWNAAYAEFCGLLRLRFSGALRMLEELAAGRMKEQSVSVLLGRLRRQQPGIV